MATTGANGHSVTVPSLAQLRSMTRGGPKGTPFDPWSHLRFFGAYQDGAVLDTAFDVRAVEKMLDGTNAQASKNANTLALPIRSAPWEIKDGPGGAREGAHAREVLGRLAKPLLDRACSGIWTKKSYHEIEWALDGPRPVIRALHWRPTASCEQRLDDQGAPLGFFQRVAGDHPSQRDQPRWPGKVWIEPLRSFVYVHGRHRDPIHGTSELATTLALHELHRKLTFLLFQFLEQDVIPRVLAYGDSITDAEANADELAASEGGGIVPWTRPAEGTRPFDVLESAGHASGMFLETLRWLEAQQSASILADFQTLADQAAGQGRGSHAMVADLRAWFEQNLQAKADELADQITEQVLRPLTVLGFGADAVVPSFSIGPVSSSESDRALDMISSTITASTVNIPPGVVDALWIKLSRKLGLDVDQVRDAVDEWRAQQDAERPGTGEEDEAGAGELADVITLAHGIATDVLAGLDPHDAVDQHLALAGKPRYVRTPAGARRYGKNIGERIGGGRDDDAPSRAGGEDGGLLDVLKREGGFTYDPRAGRALEVGERDGFAVAVPGTEQLLGDATMTEDDFVAAFRDAIRSNAEHIEQGGFIGGWRSDARGQFMIERTNVVSVPRAEAERMGRELNQEGIFDLRTGEFINTGGTGG